MWDDVADLFGSAGAALRKDRQLGQLNEYQRWELGVYENEFVKDGGVWRFKAVHYSPRLVANYEDGWAKTKPLPNFPAFHYKNLGKPAGAPAAVVTKPIEQLERMLAQAYRLRRHRKPDERVWLLLG